MKLGLTLVVLLSGAVCALAIYESSTAHEVHGARPISAFRATEPEGESLRAFVVGDTGTGDWRQRRVANAMIREAERGGADLVLHTGDAFYPVGVKSLDDPQWQEKFEDMYTGALADVPFHPVLGNHDHHGAIDVYAAYSAVSPRWRMTAQYYSFEREVDGVEVLFLALDTTPLVVQATDREEQLDWVAEQLSASDAHWKIVYGHHPVFSAGKHGGDPTLARELEPILRANGVDLYLAGHDHYLGLLQGEELVHVISGAGSKPKDATWTDETLFAFADLGFAVLVIEPDQIEVRFIDQDDELLFAWQLEKTALVSSARSPAIRGQ